MSRVEPIDDGVCPIGLSLDLLGQKWTLLIVREAFKGVQKFSDFERVLGCPRNLLSARLKLLCEEGILTTVRYEVVGQRGRQRYELTPSGCELAHTVVALFDWGTRYRSPGDQPWMEPSRCRCGAQVHAVLECEAGHRSVAVEDLHFPSRQQAAEG